MARDQGWTFGYESKFIEDQITIRSNDQTLYRHDGKVSDHFATLHYTIDVNAPGNALSIVGTVPFSMLSLSLSLYDAHTNQLISSEKTSTLEPDDEAEDITSITDMANYIEIPSLDVGRYHLDVKIRKSNFLPTQEHETCLTFGLVVEYIVHS